MLQRRTFCCAAIIVLLQLSFLCVQTVEAADTDALVSDTLLDQAGMKSAWQLNLPIRKGEQIDRMFIFDKYLYALTDTNYLFCVDRAKGKVRFGLNIASGKVPVQDPFYYDRQLIFMDGTNIKFIDPNAGVTARNEELKCIGRSAVSPVSRNSQDIFVSGTNNRISVIAEDGLWRRFWASADDDSLITSIISDDDSVVFATDGGSVVKIRDISVKKVWQYDAPGKILAGLVRDGDYIYVSSVDSKLYKVNITSGRLAWKMPFQCGQSLTTSVKTGRDCVYQFAGAKGLYAVNKDTGEQVWQLKDGVGLLAEKGDRAYVFASPGRLVAMDNATGKKVLSINFGSVTDIVGNTTDSTIYVASDDGRLMSVEAVR
ncbi:MAG: PQQ-like beta-propeller repeat protein [Anaerohalosphaera sp.]|nr:PQQ-like beta-propeller repeat protein [Anaerohalosphaera sp.]